MLKKKKQQEEKSERSKTELRGGHNRAQGPGKNAQRSRTQKCRGEKEDNTRSCNIWGLDLIKKERRASEGKPRGKTTVKRKAWGSFPPKKREALLLSSKRKGSRSMGLWAQESEPGKRTSKNFSAPIKGEFPRKS